jgi:tRNA modification GTPase
MPLRAQPVVAVSAVSGAGLPTLLDEITRAVAGAVGSAPADTPMITRARHRAALERAREELSVFRDAWSAAELPAPVAAVHVRETALALDGLIGAVDVDDVLARVFSSFCVGK